MPWLFLGLVGGLGSVFILEGFEEFMTDPNYKTLFFFTPLIAVFLKFKIVVLKPPLSLQNLAVLEAAAITELSSIAIGMV